MTDKEIFEKYCENSKANSYAWIFEEVIKKTLSYKLFKLRIAIDELKKSIKKALWGVVLWN